MGLGRRDWVWGALYGGNGIILTPGILLKKFYLHLELAPDEVEKLIGSALCKTCQLDPAPTWLVKDVRGLLSPFLALLFNRSLVDGCFPPEFKKSASEEERT